MYDNLLANVPTDLWIGGKWRKSSDGGRFDVHRSGRPRGKVASVASATVEDAKAAVDAASDACCGDWAARRPRERAEILRKAYRADDRTGRVARPTDRLENGKALRDARGEITYAAEFFRWNAEEAVRISGEFGRPPSGTNRIIVDYQPIGICVLITPWNFPAAMATRKIAPALAAGCTSF